MRLVSLLFAALLASAGSMPVHAQTMIGSTWTAKDDLLFLKMLTSLKTFAEPHYGCGDFSTIESQILQKSPTNEPPPDDAVVGPYYESWKVTMCGKQREFVFTLWQTRSGATAWRHNIPPK